MKELSLEKEFEIYKLLHKTTILQARITAYYQTIQESGIMIPFFMLESPEKKAELHVQSLLCENPEVFEILYKEAWNEYAECLP
jgi:hypothetical protein